MLLMFFREKIHFTNNTNQNFFIVKYEDMPEYTYGIVKKIFIRYIRPNSLYVCFNLQNNCINK